MFLAERAADGEFAFEEDIGKIGVERFEERRTRRFQQPDDQLLMHVAHAVINAEEAENFGDRRLDRIGDFVEREILLRDHSAAEQLFLDESLPRLPIIAARLVEHYDRQHVVLAGLHERDDFHSLIERAEPAGQQADRVGLFHEHQFAREKVFHVHQLGVAGDDLVGRLLEGEQDVQPHRIFPSRPHVSRLHDAARRARENEPMAGGHCAAELDGHAVGGMIGRRPRRAEHRHLAHAAIG